MDEMWQRHKSFILQVIVGGVLFLVAFFVMRSMYGDQNDPEKVQIRNASLLSELQSKLKNGKAPSAPSIAEQRDIALAAEKAKWTLAKRVASIAGADVKSEADRTKAYVRENIVWILETLDTIDKTQKRSPDVFVDRFDKVPQACLSSLRDTVRSVVAGKAAQTGKELDETLGLAGYPDEDIPEALHGLAIVTDLVARSLARPGVEKILQIRVSARSSFPEQTGISFVSAIGVHMELVGHPADVVQVLRSLNAVGEKDQRMTVIESIDYIVPISPEEDTTKAAFNVAGLRYESGQQAAEGEVDVRKEQILFVTCAAIGGLLIWGGTGKYNEVGASTLPSGTAVPVIAASSRDPTEGLEKLIFIGRPPLAQVRLERRPPLPELPAPLALAPWFVPPIPTPGPSAENWRPYRTRIVVAAAAAAGAAPPDEAKAEDPPEVEMPKEKKFDPSKQAKLIGKSDEETLVRFELTGAFKGQPDWTILEKWPSVTARVSTLNPRNGTVIGTTDYGAEEFANYKTAHLFHNLENEFWEERIRRGVKDTDREALTKFAQWVWETLSERVGADEAAGKYGLAARKLAIGELRKAYQLTPDLTLIRLLGEYYRGTYDMEGELQAYLAYMNDGRLNDGPAQLLVGDAYERVGATAAARALYDKAVKTGDPEAKLRVGLIAERELRLDDAMSTLKTVVNTPGVAGKALTAMARIALAQGKVQEAAGYIDQAKKEGATPALNLVLGSVQHAQGKYADAQATWSASSETGGGTTWRSNRGMALLAADDFDGASKEFIACLDDDPLNLLDPLFGLGAVFQRKGIDQRSNDYFEIALARSPFDPWILLRLGTVRLASGQAEKALKFGTDLLAIEPGCVDGLWLVGRAAASLDKPDYEKAVLYLKRAVEKEPDNKDLLHEHARTLVLAGRLDEALKVLEAATDVKSGFARNDARAMALLAWSRFLAKKPIADVFESIQRGLRANPDEDTKKWLDAVRKTMDEWDRTRIWEDAFDRQNAQEILNGWKEDDKNLGISAGIAGGQLIFTSKQVKQSAPTRDAATRLRREDDLGRFKSMEASFKASPGVETIFHMYAGTLPERGGEKPAPGGRGGRGPSGGIEIGLGCDRNGNMVLWSPVGRSGSQETVLKDAAGAERKWPMDDFHTVRILRKDDAKGIYEIWLDDERIGNPDGKSSTFEIGALSMQVGRMFGFGFLVDADSGASVDVAVELVKVTKTNR